MVEKIKEISYTTLLSTKALSFTYQVSFFYLIRHKVLLKNQGIKIPLISPNLNYPPPSPHIPPNKKKT